MNLILLPSVVILNLPKAEHLVEKSVIQIIDSISVFGHTALDTQWKPLLSLCYLSSLSSNTNIRNIKQFALIYFKNNIPFCSASYSPVTLSSSHSYAWTFMSFIITLSRELNLYSVAYIIS